MIINIIYLCASKRAKYVEYDGEWRELLTHILNITLNVFEIRAYNIPKLHQSLFISLTVYCLKSSNLVTATIRGSARQGGGAKTLPLYYFKSTTHEDACVLLPPPICHRLGAAAVS